MGVVVADVGTYIKELCTKYIELFIYKKNSSMSIFQCVPFPRDFSKPRLLGELSFISLVV